jgi:hypothetical protein
MCTSGLCGVLLTIFATVLLEHAQWVFAHFRLGSNTFTC